MTTPHLVRNTSVEYMYRDASNWKAYLRVVLAGEITDDEIATVMTHSQFLPGQVGLDSLVGTLGDGSLTEDDHPWHEMCEITLTDDVPSVYPTATEWAKQFDGIVWDEDAAAAAMEDI